MERVTLTDAAQRPELDFVLPGLLSGTVGLIVGQGAVGKSMLALHLGFSVATGYPVAGGWWRPASTGPVTLVYGEDPRDILQERLHWLRKSFSMTDAVAEEVDMSLDVRSAVGDDMRIMIRAGGMLVPGPFCEGFKQLCKGQRMVIVDPLAFLSDLDENDNGAMTQLMRMLNSIAAENGTTILVPHHVSKGGEGEREEWTAARGASALTTACRWQLYLRPPNKAECERLSIDEEMRGRWIRCAVVKSNYGPRIPEAWLFKKEGGILEYAEMHKITSFAARKKVGQREQV